MDFIKQSLTLALLLMYMPTIAQPSYKDADSAWKLMEKEFNSLSHLDIREFNDFEKEQLVLLKYRNEGLKFWNLFRNDPRRYEWLRRTIGYPYLYLHFDKSDELKDVFIKRGGYHSKMNYDWPIDQKSLKEWEAIYPRLKNEYLSYYIQNPRLNISENSLNPDYHLLISELGGFLKASLNNKYRKDKKIDLNKLRNLVLETGVYLNKENSSKPTRKQKYLFSPLGYAFTSIYKEFGLDAKDMKMFFDSVKASLTPVLRNWAIRQSSLFSLMETPFLLKHKSIKGDLVDLENMRGKVVLLDFWSTNCSSCIARMPYIKTVYDKYKIQGFEVISVCKNSKNETALIRKIEEKIGADWPTLMIGGQTPADKPNSLGAQIWRKYGFWGVPQLILLDKSGRVAMYNDKLRNGDFEPELKRLLAENYKVN